MDTRLEMDGREIEARSQGEDEAKLRDTSWQLSRARQRS